jgi:glycosyltransferase involved in cell wall biosynthesis
MVFVALVPKLLGAKVVLDVHDLMPELYQSKFGLPETHWLIRFITWTERRSVKFADKAIAVHQPHLDVLVRHGNLADKFIVLLNLPDPRIFGAQARVGSRNGPGFELIYHGTVSERHGLGVAVQAVSIARDEIPGLRLRIIGAGDAMQDLTALVGRLGVTDCVCLEGAVPLEALPGAIGDADVGIVPLLYDDFTRIMLPAKLLEYVALGKPVICSRTSTIEAYFDDSMVLYVTSGDAKELAEGIRFLYEHPEKREQLIASADRFNREYDWQRQKQLYYSLLDDLIGARQPAGTSHATPRRLR